MDLDKDTCLVMMPFKVRDASVYAKRNHWDLVYSKLIRPAVIASDLNCYRDDEDFACVDVMRRLIRYIERAEIVVCDMSSCNPNVFFELGWALRANKNVVLIIDDRTETPFDIRGLQFRRYSANLTKRGISSFVGTLTGILQKYQKEKTQVRTILEDWEPVAAAPQFMAKKCDVDIFFHRRGLTRNQAVDIAERLRVIGIKAKILEHDFNRKPDAIFLGSMVTADDARDVCKLVPYKIKYLFRPDYPDSEGGDSDGSKIGIGYDSTYNIQGRDPVRSEPVNISPRDLASLLDIRNSNATFQRLLWKLTTFDRGGGS